MKLKAKNYLSIGLVDEVEESDDVPFSGMKSGARCELGVGANGLRLKPYAHLKKSEVLEQVAAS